MKAFHQKAGSAIYTADYVEGLYEKVVSPSGIGLKDKNQIMNKVRPLVDLNLFCGDARLHFSDPSVLLD